MTKGMTVPGKCVECGEERTFTTPPPTMPLRTPLVAVHRHQPGKEPYWTISQIDGVLVMIGENNWAKCFDQ